MNPKKLIVPGVVKVMLVAVAIGAVYSMYGCNTVQGMGKDIQKAGHAIQKAGEQ